MPHIPHERVLDSTFALVRDPYRFISDRCRHHGSDLFETRLMLQKTICVSGPEAAALFYDANRFARRGAMPKAIQKTLLGVGGVQGLDEEQHRHRKGMFMSLMSPERLEKLVRLTAEEWEARLPGWRSSRRIVLYPEVREILTRSVCTWAGVPLAEPDLNARTRQIAALFDHAGSIGFRHLWSRYARNRTDAWLTTMIEDIRKGLIRPPDQSAAHIIAWHRDLNGKLLEPDVAAVELMSSDRQWQSRSISFVLHMRCIHILKSKRDFRRELADIRISLSRKFVGITPSSRPSPRGRDIRSNGTAIGSPRGAGSCSIFTAPTTTGERGIVRMSSNRSAFANGTAAASTSSHKVVEITMPAIVARASGSPSSL